MGTTWKTVRPASFSRAVKRLGSPADLYFGGDMEAAIPMAGQVSGRIDGVLPVAEIMAELVEGFGDALGAAADQYLRS